MRSCQDLQFLWHCMVYVLSRLPKDFILHVWDDDTLNKLTSKQLSAICLPPFSEVEV